MFSKSASKELSKWLICCLFGSFCISFHKKGRSLLNILPFHSDSVVNITFYLQLFQDLPYNPPVGFIDGCYVYRLQVNLCSLVGVVSHALTDGGYRDIHVQGYACPCVACHVCGQWYLLAYHLTNFLQVVVGVVLHLAVCGVGRGFLACQDG